jgi:hypothetical protein
MKTSKAIDVMMKIFSKFCLEEFNRRRSCSLINTPHLHFPVLFIESRRKSFSAEGMPQHLAILIHEKADGKCLEVTNEFLKV